MRKKVVLNNGDIATITLATVEDAQELVGYMNIIGDESDNFSFGANEYGFSVGEQEELLQGMSERSLMQVFVAKIDGEIVAQAELHLNKRHRLAHNCIIAISVRGDKWGNGLGNEMMKHLIAKVKEKIVIKTIGLEVKADNYRAISLYKKHGFITVGVKQDHLCVYGQYFDIDLMELYL